MSAACSVATAPILWLQFGAVPLLGILANVLVEPAVGPLLGLAFAAAAVDPVAPSLAAGLAWLNGWIAAYIAFCCAARRGGAGRPGARTGGGARGSGVARRRRLCLAGMADELKPAYLIAGSDRPKVDRTVARLRNRFDTDAIEVLQAAETTGDDAVAACNVMGLFGAGTRLVVIEGVEAWKAPDAKAVADYLKAPAPGTTLALVGGELKKDAPLAKAVASKGELLIWDVVMKAVARWIADQFKLQNTKVEPEACRLLAELVGDDLYELAGEVDKLATWANGDEVTEADVEALVAPRADSPPWALTDAWGARDVGAVLRRRRAHARPHAGAALACNAEARRQPHEPRAARPHRAPPGRARACRRRRRRRSSACGTRSRRRSSSGRCGTSAPRSSTAQ